MANGERNRMFLKYLVFEEDVTQGTIENNSKERVHFLVSYIPNPQVILGGLKDWIGLLYLEKELHGYTVPFQKRRYTLLFSN